MSKHQISKDIAQNLKFLASSFDSTSEFCRKVGINRQQFSKYISEKHSPSQAIQNQVAKYFLMEQHHLQMPHLDFVRFYEGNEQDLAIDFRSLPTFMRFSSLVNSSSSDIKKFHGVYYRYHKSSIYKGKVLKSVTCIFERQSVTQYVTIERFPRVDGSGMTAYKFRYQGFCFLFGDRLFMIDFENIQENEITFSSLIPQRRNPMRFLVGVVTGVAASAFRQPFSTRMAMEYVGSGFIRKEHLRSATVLAPDSTVLPGEIRDYLTEGSFDIVWGGEA
jgi:hypothetical protein